MITYNNNMETISGILPSGMVFNFTYNPSWGEVDGLLVADTYHCLPIHYASAADGSAISGCMFGWEEETRFNEYCKKNGIFPTLVKINRCNGEITCNH